MTRRHAHFASARDAENNDGTVKSLMKSYENDV